MMQDQDDSSPGEAAFWLENTSCPGVVCEGEPPPAHPFDLEERTTAFGCAIVRFARRIPQSPVNNRLIDQVVGAGTSVGANYVEADDSVSPRDFLHRISICRKEARETQFFLRMIVESEPTLKPEARLLWQEAKELHLIFSAIWRRKTAPSREEVWNGAVTLNQRHPSSFVIRDSDFGLLNRRNA
jgi:four helix bundle protein